MIHWIRARRLRTTECKKVLDSLQTYLDHEFEIAEQVTGMTVEQLRRHVESCKKCGLGLEAYGKIKEAVACHAPLEDPASLERIESFTASLIAGDLDPPQP